MKELKNKLREALDMCNSLYPEDEDPNSDINGGPKQLDTGKPMESDSPGNDFGDKEMRKKTISRMIAKKISGA